MAIFISEDKISKIKNTADIVDIVSEVVLLKKTGKNYIGLCPFHSEKTPSFTVSPEKQIFYCFGCGVGGNVFSFLMKQDGLSFPDAATMLAGRYGIDIPTQTMSPEQKRRMSERESLLAANKLAMNFFRHSLLETAAGKKAMAYLNKRGITKETIDSFNLGYAPESWNNLANFFSKKGISLALVEKSGLVIPRKDKNSFYNRFRDRIIFPIFDVSMQIIGFGGRVMNDSLPKYLNSPETILYNKSRSLYGLNMAKGKCRKSETVYIAEGYFDLLALHQHGVQNSVATLGTSLTLEHIQMLRGFIGKTGKVVLVYDSDAAGIKAALRSIEIFNKGYVDAKILILPAGYDPDSYLFEFGFESFMNTASKALGIIPFLIDSATKKHGLSVEGKINIISDLKKPLTAINDFVARELYIRELAERIGIDETAILKKIKDTSGGKVIQSIAVHEQESKFERRIVAMMLQFQKILSEISKRNILEYFENNTLKSIGEIILKHRNGSDVQSHSSCISADDSGRISEIMNLIDDKKKRNIIASLAIGEERWNSEGCLKLIQQFENSQNRRKNSLFQKKIKAAAGENDRELLDKLLKEKLIQAKKRQKNLRLADLGKT